MSKSDVNSKRNSFMAGNELNAETVALQVEPVEKVLTYTCSVSQMVSAIDASNRF